MIIKQKFSKITVAQLLWIFPICFLCLSIFNIWNPYSYWMDELYSTINSSLGFSEMMREIFADVHPPLYQILLWVWINLFGNSEFATRSMSLLFASTAFVYLSFWLGKRDSLLAILIISFFVASPLYAYYAQETRSYSLLMLLSVLAITLLFDYKKNSDKFGVLIFVLVLMAITHYFGLLMSGMAMVYIFWMERRNKLRLCALFLAGSLTLAWPLLQAFYGNIINKTEGAFWIEVSSPLETLTIAASAAVPALTSALDEYAVLIYPLLLAILILLLFIIGSRDRILSYIKENRNEAKLVYFPLIFTGIFVLAVLVIDTYMPISTKRNYIVITGAMSLALGTVSYILIRTIKGKPGRIFICSVVASYLFASIALTGVFLYRKWMPLENWKAAAEYIKSKTVPGDMVYIFPRYRWRYYKFYLDKVNAEVKLSHIEPGSFSDLPGPAIGFFGHVEPDFVSSQLGIGKENQKFRVYYPTQYSAQPVVVIIKLH